MDFSKWLNLLDIWRHPTDLQYTWSNKSFLAQARIDLISEDMKSQVTEVKNCPAVLTDYKIIHLKANLSTNESRRVYNDWKLNSLLNNIELTSFIQKLIKQYWTIAQNNNLGKYWELLKYEIRRHVIQFSKRINCVEKEKLEQLDLSQTLLLTC